MKSSSTFALLGEMTGASYLISMVFKICHPKLKCRWFFGRVFSFPLVEKICVTGKETGPRPGDYG